jgi:hypothetical protein
MAQSSDFTIYPVGATEWCACREDGLVCGVFVNQACALRFAKRETRNRGAITVRREPPEAVPAALAA